MSPHGIDSSLFELPALARDLRRLRAVSAVLASGSVVGAAQALHVSQPALTRAVRELEKTLGFALFERASRGMVATAPGRIVGVRLRRAWMELERATAEAVALGGGGPCERPLRCTRRLAATVSARALECLIAIGELGSEPRVARKLGLTQPSVHHQLSELEHLAQVRLYDRAPRGTALTEAGKALVRGAKLALGEIRIGEEELAAFSGKVQGRVTIGSLPLSSAFFVPRSVDVAARRHRDLRVSVVDGTYAALVDALREGDVDLIVGALRPASETLDLAQETLFQDRLAIVARAGHPLLRAPPRALADLIDEPWVLPLPGTPSRRTVDEAFEAAGLRMPALQVQANSPGVVRSLLVEGDWIALVSPLQVHGELRAGALRLVDLAIEQSPRPIGIMTRRAGCVSPGASAVIDQLRALASVVKAMEVVSAAPLPA